jgi:predicted acylesterase/phospholipase RssA
VYVGTSAGAFVAALTANGITPEEMMRVVNRQVPTAFRDVDVGQLLRPNVLEFAASAVKLPFRTLGLARSFAGQLGQLSAMDVVLGLAEVLPSGAYSSAGIERYMRTVLSDPDRTNDFRLLENELYLAATDLDTCERIVFGANDWDDVPISTAVSASAALPMVYKPVEVKDRELVDGGIVSSWSTRLSRSSTTSRRRSRRCSARVCGGCPTWASPRSATSRSSCWPTSGCTSSRGSGRSATRAWTSC